MTSDVRISRRAFFVRHLLEKRILGNHFFFANYVVPAHGYRVFLSHGINASIPPWNVLLGNAYMGSSRKDTYMWNRQSECAVQYLITARNIADHFTHVSMLFFNYEVTFGIFM
ncbi:hypothetical protein ACFX13_005332 [Malus domestica]